MKSKKALAFEKFKFSDPGWNAEVIPIAGSTSVAICAASVDKYTGRKMYGQQLGDSREGMQRAERVKSSYACHRIPVTNFIKGSSICWGPFSVFSSNTCKHLGT